MHNNNENYTMKPKIWEHSLWIKETSPEALKEVLCDILSKSGFKVLKYQEHAFQPQGLTALWLLSESHLAIHTFPEHQQTYLQLSSCMMPHYIKFIELIEKAYG